jgi:glycosyltransferase involved in cell wall biosynthesis
LNFHGPQPNKEVIDSIEQADVGFCLLTEETDWYYAHPIKIGEYLAGGTIPIASAFPGIQQLTRDAGILIKPDHNEVAEAIETIATDNELRHTLGERARERARALDWRDEREWFAKQALFGTDCWRSKR